MIENYRLFLRTLCSQTTELREYVQYNKTNIKKYTHIYIYIYIYYIQWLFFSSYKKISSAKMRNPNTRACTQAKKERKNSGNRSLGGGRPPRTGFYWNRCVLQKRVFFCLYPLFLTNLLIEVNMIRTQLAQDIPSFLCHGFQKQIHRRQTTIPYGMALSLIKKMKITLQD